MPASKTSRPVRIGIIGSGAVSDYHHVPAIRLDPRAELVAACDSNAALLASRKADWDIDLVSTHATGTTAGDAQECEAVRLVFSPDGPTLFNNTKSFIGHAMGAAGALELAGNLPAFQDRVCHATINLDRLDPDCALPGLVSNQPREMDRAETILNTSFGMLGINSVVIVRRL